MPLPARMMARAPQGRRPSLWRAVASSSGSSSLRSRSSRGSARRRRRRPNRVRNPWDLPVPAGSRSTGRIGPASHPTRWRWPHLLGMMKGWGRLGRRRPGFRRMCGRRFLGWPGASPSKVVLNHRLPPRRPSRPGRTGSLGKAGDPRKIGRRRMTGLPQKAPPSVLLSRKGGYRQCPCPLPMGRRRHPASPSQPISNPGSPWQHRHRGAERPDPETGSEAGCSGRAPPRSFGGPLS